MSGFVPFVHAETESQARASQGKALVFHLRYASQVLQIRSQYLNPDNFQAFSPFPSSSGDTITTPVSVHQLFSRTKIVSSAQAGSISSAVYMSGSILFDCSFFFCIPFIALVL